jgi:DNA polymerase III alpha subunit (gram-positive type)
VRFDGRILASEFKRAVHKGELKKGDVGDFGGITTLDTLGLDRHLNPNEQRYTLGHVAERWGVHNWQRHRAIGDADASIRILTAMSDHLPESLEQVAEISKNSIRQWQEKWAKKNGQLPLAGQATQ